MIKEIKTNFKRSDCMYDSADGTFMGTYDEVKEYAPDCDFDLDELIADAVAEIPFGELLDGEDCWLIRVSDDFLEVDVDYYITDLTTSDLLLIFDETYNK